MIALSLSIDTLAVTVSSSVTLKKASFGRILYTSLMFGIIQSLLLFIGWACGASVLSFIHKIAGVIGFVMLLYIGGSMILEACRKGCCEEETDLNGFKAVLLAGIATSIDASAVGVSFAMTRISVPDLIVSLVTVLLITFIAAISGIYGGCYMGRRFGKPAQFIGGLVLIIIGIRILLG